MYIVKKLTKMLNYLMTSNTIYSVCSMYYLVSDLGTFILSFNSFQISSFEFDRILLSNTLLQKLLNDFWGFTSAYDMRELLISQCQMY